MTGTIPKLIAADLDGTILTTDKRVTDRTARVLREMHERFGTEIVPATGRMLTGIPDDVWKIGCIRYAITENGAGIHDTASHRLLFRCGIPFREAAELIGYLDTLPLLYDCYIDGKAYMPERFFRDAGTVIRNRSLLEMIRTRWIAVRDLRERIAETGSDVMKVQCYIRSRNESERAAVKAENVSLRFKPVLSESARKTRAENGRKNAANLRNSKLSKSKQEGGNP